MAPTTLEGQTLGKYRILEPLGRGGMAQVYRAYHASLDRYVAIKVLRSDLVEEEEFLARFRREARSIASLRHANIVQVFDFDVQDGLYYMVMELLEGDTLKARLNTYRERKEIMPISEMVRILTDVLKGLQYAHADGIIHRDIKPANILLSKRGEAVITDFGIAQIVGGTNYTVSGALMGTLHYMPPEQGLGTKVDHRSDIYSLGVVLYEMLTGHPPFDADTPLAILLKHLNDPLPIPREPDPIIPKPFERVVLKALAKQPEDRYQSALEMMKALDDAMADCPEAAPARIVETDATGDDGAHSEGVSQEALAPVYSGTARQNIADAEFAEDDTEFNLEQKLKPEEPSGGSQQSVPLEQAVGDVSKAAVALMTTMGGMVSHVLLTTAEQNKDRVPVIANLLNEAAEDTNDYPPKHVAKAAIVGVSVLVGMNLLAVSTGISTGWWAMFQFGWPMELLLVSILLSLLMSSLANIYMMIPVGILFGNGLLMSFYSLTGWWNMWAFLWPLELAIVFCSIGGPISIARSRPMRAKRLARMMGLSLALLAAGVVVAVGLFSNVAGAFHRLF